MTCVIITMTLKKREETQSEIYWKEIFLHLKIKLKKMSILKDASAKTVSVKRNIVNALNEVFHAQTSVNAKIVGTPVYPVAPIIILQWTINLLLKMKMSQCLLENISLTLSLTTRARTLCIRKSIIKVFQQIFLNNRTNFTRDNLIWTKNHIIMDLIWTKMR